MNPTHTPKPGRLRRSQPWNLSQVLIGSCPTASALKHSLSDSLSEGWVAGLSVTGVFSDSNSKIRNLTTGYDLSIVKNKCPEKS